MKPRERVLAAVSGKEVFPVPVDVFENGLYPKLEAGLREYFSLQTADYENVLRALGAEIRWGTPPYIGLPLEEGNLEGEISYPFRKIYRNIWGTWEGLETYTDLLERPLAKAETVHDVEAHTWPTADMFDYSRMAWFTYPEGFTYSMAEWTEQNADFARIAGGWNPVFSRVMDLFGFENGLVKIISSPELIHATMDKISEFYEEFYRRLAKSAEGHADFLGFGDDFASQNGMTLSPKKWREYFLPLWKRLFAIAHEHNLKPFMHMCGGVRPVLGDLIDAGLEVFEVVQVTAKGMDPAELKQEFGKDLTFYGGVNTQQTLPYGTPEDVRDEVRQRIEVLGKGGRYILASMHFLMDDVPVENVVSMYDEAFNFRPSGSN